MGFIDPEFKPTLAALGLDKANNIWSLSLERVDDPNRARGGWSEVGRYPLPESVGDVDTLYIKRQEDFGYRKWPNIFSKKPTLEREYNNLVWCLDHDIPVVKPLAYFRNDVNNHQRAILITAGLTKYIPLSDIGRPGDIEEEQRKRLLGAIAKIVFHMHQQGLQHNCLYPKHIFINDGFLNNDKNDIRLIDLEKARPISRWNGGIFRDLDSLNRRSMMWPKEDRLYFFEQYYQWGDGRDGVLLKRLKQSYSAE